MTDAVESPLTDDEARTLVKLLARYCNHDFGHWDDWHVSMPRGDVYVTITNSLPPDWPAEAFHQVWPLTPSLPPKTPDDQPDTGAWHQRCADVWSRSGSQSGVSMSFDRGQGRREFVARLFPGAPSRAGLA